jgi:hypothetical protein
MIYVVIWVACGLVGLAISASKKAGRSAVTGGDLLGAILLGPLLMATSIVMPYEEQYDQTKSDRIIAGDSTELNEDHLKVLKHIARRGKYNPEAEDPIAWDKYRTKRVLTDLTSLPQPLLNCSEGVYSLSEQGVTKCRSLDTNVNANEEVTSTPQILVGSESVETDSLDTKQNELLVDLRNAVIQSYGTLRPDSAEDQEINAQTVGELRSWFDSDGRHIPPSVVPVVKRFVDAELDFITEGNRGMGRMTDECPRFGGKHRRVLKGVSAAQTNELRRLFVRQICCGYLFAEYVVEIMSNAACPSYSSNVDSENLFHQWVPLIYSIAGAPGFDKSLVERGMDQYYDIKHLWGQGAGNAMLECFAKGGIQIDEFERMLLRYYFDGGIALRMVVARKPQRSG